MSLKPRPVRPRYKPKTRPRSRPRLFLPTPLPVPQTSVQAHWSPDPVTLEDLLKAYPLPQVVQCRTSVLRSHDDRPFPVQLDKPILLADQRTARHLLARIVVFDDKSRTFSESTDSVVIPEDYEGHFLKLQSRTTKDKTHAQSLESIAHGDTPAFLNLSDLTSFPAGPRDRFDQSRLVYTVGNVFLVDEPLPTNLSHVNSASSGSSRHKSETTGSSVGSGNGLMRCLDERGVAVMVPTNQSGEMVAVQKNDDQRPKLSVKSSEMIAAGAHFPVLARYAYGKRPPRLTAFSKLFTLLDSFQETSIIACTMDGPSIMLMELPLMSSLQFQVALNSSELLKVPRVHNALQVCRTRGQELARDIKFKLKFSHRMQETSRRVPKPEEDEEDLLSATLRTRLVVTETYLYI